MVEHVLTAQPVDSAQQVLHMLLSAHPELTRHQLEVNQSMIARYAQLDRYVLYMDCKLL